MGHILRNCPKKNKKTADTDRDTADKATNVKETRTLDRPPDRKMGTVSLMAAVERGEFNGSGLGQSFLVMELKNNMEEVNGKLPR